MRSTGDPVITYEEVDTSLVPPRPRLYGIVGGDIIEEVWKERQAKRDNNRDSANGAVAGEKQSVGAS